MIFMMTLLSLMAMLLLSNASDESSDCSNYNSDEEAFAEPIPVNLYQVPGQTIIPGRPVKLYVNQNQDLSTPLPLCLLFNARSIFNKAHNLTEMLSQISPDICMIWKAGSQNEEDLILCWAVHNTKVFLIIARNGPQVEVVQYCIMKADFQ